MTDGQERTIADKSYEETIANDFFIMIQEAVENGVDVDAGFDTTPMSMQNAVLRYMFYSKKALQSMGLPMALKKKLGVSNILTAVEVGGKPVGVHLVCTMSVPFSKVSTEDQVRRGIQSKALGDFRDNVAKLMRRGFETDQNAPVH